MKKIIILLLVTAFFGLGREVSAIEDVEVAESSESAQASMSATVAVTPSVIKENITESGSEEVRYRLESVLEKQELGEWNGINTARKVVRWAIDKGVAANTIVLLLMLPLVATLVSVLHYIFGFSGHGIFMPTIIAVTFLATGIIGGLLLFAMILLISIAGGLILKKLKLHFWPSRSINLMLISVGTFGLMLASSYVQLIDISKISIFPILFMILLAEEFVRTQLVKSKKEAKRLTLGTLILAISGAITMNFRWVQEVVLLNPGIVILLVIVVNLLVGNYSGIRLSEISRFKKAIREK